MRNIHTFVTMLAIVLPACGGNDRSPELPERESSAQETRLQKIPKFDGTKAFEHLVRITAYGPRNPNSRGHQECLTFLSSFLGTLADSVRIQSFTHRGYDGKVLRLSNIVASFNPENTSRVLLCTHWDTRPRAERDMDPERWNEPILGANDGASGCAVLLELAAMLKRQPPSIGVDLVFFDGEDYGMEGDTPNYLLGSRYFARNKPDTYAPLFGILLDMVGDAQLEIPKEGNSVALAPDIVNLVWQAAAALGYSEFVDRVGEAITDDHLPLNEVGIPTINVIDFAYPDQTHRYWHTHEDTPDKCSPESLEAVGTVLTHVLYSQAPDE